MHSIAPVKTLALGMGCAPLGNLFEAISEPRAQAALAAALATGCQDFDTAPHYGNGLSEHRLGVALRNVPRDSVNVSSKVGRLLRPSAHAPGAQHGYTDVLPFEQVWDYSAAGVRRSVEDSLQRLGLARLDIAYVHDCCAVTHGAAYPNVLHQVIHEAIPALKRLKAEGLIGSYGLGVNDVQVCFDVLAQCDLDALMLAGRYSLIDHSAAALLALCAQKRVRVHLGGVFNSGILATGTRGRAVPLFNYATASAHWIVQVNAIEKVCDAFALPLRAAALQFPLAHPAVQKIMVGVRSNEEWLDALAMAQYPIPPEFWSALRVAGLLPKEVVPA